ncbi:hypothetical protein QTG54_013790, partial [Skeletonema marinoi]
MLWNSPACVDEHNIISVICCCFVMICHDAQTAQLASDHCFFFLLLLENDLNVTRLNKKELPHKHQYGVSSLSKSKLVVTDGLDVSKIIQKSKATEGLRYNTSLLSTYTNNTTTVKMPNIHGLSSIRNNDRRPPTNNNSDSDSEDNDENNRYVGGVSSRGGGSGLAVLPNHESGGGRNAAAASDSIFNLAEAGGEQAATAAAGSGGEVRRMITMYRSGFTVDNGPYRRLEDPSNAEFLGSLARGLIPRELREDAEESGGGEVMVGLVDKRGEEYDEDRHGQQQQRGGGGGFGGGSGGGD